MEGLHISDLTSLKIPSGWITHVNALEGLTATADASERLKGNLLLLSNPSKKRIVDAGWSPEGSVNGEYCLIVMKMGLEGIYTMFYSTMDDFIYTYRTRDFSQLVNKINDILLDTP